jgi:DNA (cytosine-5)-methyltransferase 1
LTSYTLCRALSIDITEQMFHLGAGECAGDFALTVVVQAPPPALWPVAPQSDRAVEEFELRDALVWKVVRRRSGALVRSPFVSSPGFARRPRLAEAEAAFLAAATRPSVVTAAGDLRVVDLFCGAGGLSLGVREACIALGLNFVPVLAVDLEDSAISVYQRNFSPIRVHHGDITQLIDGPLGAAPTATERKLVDDLGPADLVIGGPPCEGHSDFNNRTRHWDGRNELYTRMVRAAELFSPAALIVENVPGALRDGTGVIHRAVARLQALGYVVSYDVVDTRQLGVAQRRKRLILVAARGAFDLAAAVATHSTEVRDLSWAIGDLALQPGATTLLDVPAESAADTRRRIAYLFDHDLFELPDCERPTCHSLRRHSYKSVYGRLRWDLPAQTITSGFYSMCMGRYVHPSEPRTITAHEAARIQFFPDFFDFTPVRKRTQLARLIGDAAPMKLSYIVALELLR